MNNTTKTQCTPADIFANIPGMLGFYPKESFVLGFFLPNNDHGYTLGPLARVNIDDKQHYEVVFAGVRQHTPKMLVFVYAITGRIDSATVMQHLQHLMRIAVRNGVRLEAGWSVTEIYAGAPYHRLFGPSAEQLSNTTTGVECWDAGHVTPPSTSIALQHLATGGELPEVDRQATFQYFEADCACDTAASAGVLADRGQAEGAALVKCITQGGATGQHAFTVAITEFRTLLERLVAEDSTAAVLTQDTEALALAAKYWSQTLLRDSTLKLVCGTYSPKVVHLALAAARVFGGEIRANALCVFAVATLAGRVWVRALPAVRVALEEVPQHRFALLLHEALTQGCGSMVVASCVQAADFLANSYGEDSDITA